MIRQASRLKVLTAVAVVSLLMAAIAWSQQSTQNSQNTQSSQSQTTTTKSSQGTATASSSASGRASASGNAGGSQSSGGSVNAGGTLGPSKGYVVLYRQAAASARVQQLLQAHDAYLRDGAQKGWVKAVGRYMDDESQWVYVTVANPAQAQEWALGDPAVAAKALSIEIRPFEMRFVAVSQAAAGRASDSPSQATTRSGSVP